MRQRLKCRNGGREKKKKRGKKKGREGKETHQTDVKYVTVVHGQRVMAPSKGLAIGIQEGAEPPSHHPQPKKITSLKSQPSLFLFFSFFFCYQGNKAVNKRKSDTVSRGVITWEGRSAWETAAAMQQRCNAPGMLQAHQGHAGLEATTPGQSPVPAAGGQGACTAYG